MRTDATLTALADRLEINCGDLHEAARAVGVSPNFVHQWMKDDEKAAERLREAQLVGYGGLESAAIQRAVHGVAEDVYYKGMVVGEKIVRSDGLLGKLLEARVPAYSKKEQSTFSAQNMQINIMPRADSYEDWLSMRDQTLNRTKELPAPEKVIEGEFTEVPRIAEFEGLGI